MYGEDEIHDDSSYLHKNIQGRDKIMKRRSLHMAVCDDEPEDIVRICDTVRQILKELKYYGKYEFHCFTDSRELYDFASKECFSLIFLDIEMPGMDGFELASKLRQKAPGTHLIFISNYEQFVFDSYEYAPFWFIRKSFLQHDMYRAMCRYMKLLFELHITYRVRDKSGFKELRIKDILYVESEKHTLSFRTVQGAVLKKHGSLRDVEKELEPYGFLRVHKSYLVNIHHIEQVETQDVLLCGNIRVAMGRDREKRIHEAMIRYGKE